MMIMPINMVVGAAFDEFDFLEFIIGTPVKICGFLMRKHDLQLSKQPVPPFWLPHSLLPPGWKKMRVTMHPSIVPFFFI